MRILEPSSSDTESRLDESGAASAARALSGFAAAVRREFEAVESPEFEELRRAVDGELEPTEQALWEERLAGDPALARRVADLARFRAEFWGVPEAIEPPARILTFRRPPARVSLSGWIAAAAVLLLAVVVREVPRWVNEQGSVSAALPRLLDWSDEKLFADGFEAGDASVWTTASPST